MSIVKQRPWVTFAVAYLGLLVVSGLLASAIAPRAERAALGATAKPQGLGSVFSDNWCN